MLDDDAEKEDEEGEDGNERREKARALWKARQQFKAQLGAGDSNSLSHFDLFAEKTDEAKVEDKKSESRARAIRKRLENASRPVASEVLEEEPGKPTRNIGKRDAPDWREHQAAREEKERKRRRAVSMGSWSYTERGSRSRPSLRSGKAGGSSVGTVSGFGYTVRKGRKQGERVAPRAGGMSSIRKPAKRSTDAPTSFTGLLGLINKRTETNA